MATDESRVEQEGDYGAYPAGRKWKNQLQRIFFHSGGHGSRRGISAEPMKRQAQGEGGPRAGLGFD